jgi:hypothetical protein
MGDMTTGQLGGADPRRRRPRSGGSSVLTPPTGLPVFPDLEASEAERADIIRCCRDLPRTVLDPCLCGHGRSSHEHYRPGWDCGICGAATCVDYRPVEGGPVRRMLRRLGLTT